MKTYRIDFCDLEGTVESVEHLLSNFPPEATIELQSERKYGYGGWTDAETQFLVVSVEELEKKPGVPLLTGFET